ncbi:hypothetical protein KAFR_0G01110 [Kazachstania africana CBS 2517]|uniref:Protein transport protein SFT2 n=1 Tax=Kazachstania africana (strain ATCC 22294 / BCRC 22015 / CBS 2517 / CECT 1963 / NBRC 1671 / NRRL Y-8276) TaxID=1071382 RepID=H2AXP4_KAZAF|nr:hypothetical protein KAFR_0G01110 [Kazachstania africana CBS 2517]CCF59144.1 hypothetical protein KAFR_0G01110 [Kazachstania africana CBS 2517]
MADSNDSQINQLRESLNRWSTNRTQEPQSINESAKTMFASWADSINERASDIYQRLPMTRQDLVEDAEPSWFTLSRSERLLLFICFILGSAACFTLCVFLFPVLAINPRKFALLWTMGSLLFVLAFGVMMGPVAYIKHLTSKERVPFTLFFFFSCLLTIYFAAFAKSTVLTIISAVLELIAVLYYAVSYFPMGAAGLRIISTVGVNTARGVLRI